MSWKSLSGQKNVSFIHRDKSKATNIHRRTSYNNNNDHKPSSNSNCIKKHIILLRNPTTVLIGKKIKLLRH